jgi:hypothetical protein
MPAALRRLAAPTAVLLGAALLRLLAGVGFANYDTLYALTWGQQLARGETPQYGLPIAPTPHPLVEALGLLLSPLGPRAVSDVVVALGFIALAGCGWVVYRLGSLWFGRLAGGLAALLLLTRVPVLSYGVRAYVDVPYLLLVLCALLVACRPRARGEWRPVVEGPAVGGPAVRGPAVERPAVEPSVAGSADQRPAAVLSLLALAGLLRPEAWVFSGLYWLYLAFHVRLARPRLVWLAGLICVAPLLWLLGDLLVTGNALWSLTNTRATAHQLGRETGILKVPEYIPRRLGEILRPPVLLGAALGGVLSLLWLRRRALVPALVGVAAVAVFAFFATFGLPINTRYAFLAAALLCIFCGAGVFGWTLLPAGDRRRRWWMLGGAIVVLALLGYAPAQYRGAHRELSNLAHQQRIENDLLALVSAHAISLRCGNVGVPNHRPIPLLALRLQTAPAHIVSAQVSSLRRGVYIDPASRYVETEFILDQLDPVEPRAHVPAGFALVRANRSWRVYRRCT